MAKQVKITWTQSTGNTVAPISHIVQRSATENGTYATIYTALGVTVEHTDVNVLDGETWWYRVGAVFASGTIKYLAAKDITISATLVTNSLELTVGEDQILTIPASTIAIGDKISFRVNSSVFGSSDWYVAIDVLNSGANGFIGLRTSPTAGNARIALYMAGTDTYEGSSYTIALGDLVELEYLSANSATLKINGVLIDTATVSGFIPANEKIVFGAMTDAAYQNLGFEIYDISVRGETWDLSEQTGSTATGSLGTIITLIPGTGLTSTMWNTI